MKKLLSVLIVLVLIAGMTVGAAAATVTSSKVRRIDEDNFMDILETNMASGKVTLSVPAGRSTTDTKISSLSELADLEVTPGSELRIYLTADMFLDSNGKLSGAKNDILPLSALGSGRITVRTSVATENSPITVSLAGDKRQAYIKVEFARSPGYNGKKFSNSIFFAVNGSRRSATRIAIKGIMQPTEIEIDAYDDYIDISKGEVLKATETIKNIEINIGENLIIRRNLARNKKYSGFATTDILTKDEPIFNKYPSLDYIYRLETVGLKAEGNIVIFDMEDTYYVYNTNGTYIGTSDKALPYWTKYYLSSKKYASIEVVK